MLSSLEIILVSLCPLFSDEGLNQLLCHNAWENHWNSWLTSTKTQVSTERKKTLRGRVLVLTFNITQLITIILHKYWKNWIVHNILTLDKLGSSPTPPPPPARCKKAGYAPAKAVYFICEPCYCLTFCKHQFLSGGGGGGGGGSDAKLQAVSLERRDGSYNLQCHISIRLKV